MVVCVGMAEFSVFQFKQNTSPFQAQAQARAQAQANHHQAHTTMYNNKQ